MKYIHLIKASEGWDANYIESNFKNEWGDINSYYLVNMDGDGNELVGVRVWPGSGYQTNGFLVRYNGDISDALYYVGKYMLEHKIKGAYTASEMEEWVIDNLNDDGIDVTDKTIESYMMSDQFQEDYYWTEDVWINRENMKIKEFERIK